MAEKWIFDNDGGIDDAYALVLALSQPSKMTLPLITIVGGSVPVEIAAKAVSRTLEICKVKVPIYIGAEEGLVQKADPIFNLMGNDGQGDAPEYTHLQGYTECIRRDMHAVYAILKAINENPGNISIIATGPLTNIALALKLDPSIAKKVKRFVVMGGTHYGKGNTTRAAEYNFHCDPEAAEICIQKMPFIEILTVENGYECVLSEEEHRMWHNIKTVKGNFLHCISQKIQKTLGRLDIYDPIAVAIALNPSIVKECIKADCNVELHGSTTRGMLV
eukprot:TRINITY_DN1611_c0_g1_i1.p2 TRINITY_DN1611_c0_g1~~TRINITY_DN1611_c0_g1_i1.p2  ORF type:complete len:276 (-),score=34.46 TRINITY_DN1611_c0_g1_i1:282-1109(-)